jgi:16S rRNA processing protein RimM
MSGSADDVGVARLVAIGRVRRPVGLSGACYVEAFGATLESLAPPVLLRAGTEPEVAREVVMTSMRPGPRGPVCAFEGISDMDAAGTLRGWYLFCGRDLLPKLPEGRHYQFELEGLAVLGAESGRVIGTVTGVQNYPTVDALEVRREDGSSILISMTRETVRAVDRATGTITVLESAIEDIL